MPIVDILLTQQELDAIIEKAPSKLPLNPTNQGYSGQEVRRRLDRYVIDTTNSVLAVLADKLQHIHDSFEEGFQQVWFFESTDPTEDDGKANDLWLNLTSMDIFLNEDGTWVLQGNIKGIQGEKGVSLRILGDWNPLVSYVYNSVYQDIVHYEGASYYCKVSKPGNAGNQDPATDTVTWGLFTKQGTSFRHRGEWDGDTTYYHDEDHVDVATYLGDLYYAKVTITGTGNNNPLVDTTRWGLYTEKGVSFRVFDTWDEDANYFNDSSFIDVVPYDGKAYYCKLTVTTTGNSAPPIDTTHWGIYLDNTMGIYDDLSSSSINHTLIDNEDSTYTYDGISDVTIVIPSTISHGFISSVNFKASGTPSQVVFTNNSALTLKIIKYGMPISSYTPEADYNIELLFYCNGLNITCIIHEVE